MTMGCDVSIAFSLSSQLVYLYTLFSPSNLSFTNIGVTSTCLTKEGSMNDILHGQDDSANDVVRRFCV